MSLARAFAGQGSAHSERRRAKSLLILLVAFGISAAAVFAVVATGVPIEEHGESGKYVSPAIGMLETGRFAEFIDGEVVPETFRLPGFPALIAAAFAVFGRDNYVAIALIQSAFTALIVLASALTAAEVRREWFLPAGILAAMWPDLVWRTTTIMPETTFTVFFAWGVYFGIRAARGPAAPWLFAAGVAWGAANLTRPVMAGFAPFAFLALWYLLSSRVGWLKAAGLAILPLIVVFLCAAPLMARNAQLYGAFKTTASAGEVAVHWMYPCLAQTFGCGDRNEILLARSEEEARRRIEALDPSVRDNPFVQDEVRRDLAIESIAQLNPMTILSSALGSYAKVMLHTTFVEVPERFGGAISLFSDQTSPEDRAWTVAWGVFQVGVLAAIALQLAGVTAGLAEVRTRRQFTYLILAAAPLILVSLGIGNPRHRAPIEPILVVFFVAGAFWAYGVLRRISSRRNIISRPAH